MTPNIKTVFNLAHEKMFNKIWDKYREPGYRYYHSLRTAELAQLLIKEIPDLVNELPNQDVIIAAALLHDIKKMENPHAVKGANYVKKYLKKHGLFTADEQLKIVEIIRSHNTRQEPLHPAYIKLVQDADVMSRYGTVQLFSECYKSGMKKQTRESMIKTFYLLENKYQSDLDKLNYEYSKSYITEQFDALKVFYETMASELKLNIR